MQLVAMVYLFLRGLASVGAGQLLAWTGISRLPHDYLTSYITKRARKAEKKHRQKLFEELVALRITDDPYLMNYADDWIANVQQTICFFKALSSWFMLGQEQRNRQAVHDESLFKLNCPEPDLRYIYFL